MIYVYLRTSLCCVQYIHIALQQLLLHLVQAKGSQVAGRDHGRDLIADRICIACCLIGKP